MSNATDGRHLSRQGLQQYLASGNPSALKIAGSPAVYLVLEPAEFRLALRVPLAKNSLPDLSRFQNLTCGVVHWEGAQWCQISVSGNVLEDAYPLLVAIADRVQLLNLDFARAVTASLAAFGEVLAGEALWNEEKRIGLFGELLLLEHLLRNLPAEEALSCWRGADFEEHDFDCGSVDVEVKSTTLETRTHWISSLSQLNPTLGRPLWLISIQLTGAGTNGRSLGELISEIEHKLTPPLTESFRDKLAAVGWRDHHVLDTRKLRLRSVPASYLVDQEFPALTERALKSAGFSTEKIVQLRYMLDLSQIPSSTGAPNLIDEFSAGENYE